MTTRQGGVHPEVGHRLRQERERKRIEQRDLAQQLNVSQATVSRWETGDREPSLIQIEAIATALGVNPAWLIGWRDRR